MGGAQQLLRRPHLLAQLLVPDKVAAPKPGGDRVQASLAISIKLSTKLLDTLTHINLECDLKSHCWGRGMHPSRADQAQMGRLISWYATRVRYGLLQEVSAPEAPLCCNPLTGLIELYECRGFGSSPL